MFDLSNKPILSPSTGLATLAFAALVSAAIGACFNGNDADGLPCSDKSQCGPGTSCIDGYCAGVFKCADGSLVDASNVCNAEPDCEDESDEDPTVCGGPTPVNVNQCEEPDGELAYRLGLSRSGSANALGVVAIDIQGTPSVDAISAAQGDMGVHIQFDLDGTPMEYVLPGPPPASFDGRTVLGFDVSELNGDDKTDIVVVTAAGDEGAIYVYRNMAPEPPQQWGQLNLLPAVAGIVPRSFELGRLDEGNAADIVGIVDIGADHGVLLVALGDPAAPDMGGQYFGATTMSLPIGYDVFSDSALADIDGDGLDDLLVSGADGTGPGLWHVRRVTDDTGWAVPVRLPLMSTGWIAVGRFSGSPPPGEMIGPMPDIAVLDPNTNRIETMLNMNGMMQPGVQTSVEGSGFTGLTIADMNCDGQGDFVYGLTNPSEIRVLFGDGEGGVIENAALAYVDEGTPRGRLDVALFDQDSTPDIFTAADAGAGQAQPQVRILVTGSE